MANTFSQMYIQIVFAVKGRQSLIQSSWEEHLYRVITGVIQQKGQKLIVINGVADHIHILIGMKPSCCLSDLVREVKKASNDLINQERYTHQPFAWQEGFGCFSYHQSMLHTVIRYIERQKEHHQQSTFQTEYTTLLNRFDIPFEDKYLFDWID
nr:IS200/IS605 family transposase [uncultured Arsenicibacter sp.]